MSRYPFSLFPALFWDKFPNKIASYPLIGVAVFIGAGSPRATFSGSEDIRVEVHGKGGQAGGRFSVEVASLGFERLLELRISLEETG